jgi:4-diphosphocytidyl-2-C-methyl-D-erythritol kinase
VLVAARALAERVEGLRLGRFELTKHLPVGAGLGGGSADAAAALRLLAEANGLAPDDPRLLIAAKETGADVAVCLESKARVVTGIGDQLSPPLALPSLSAVLVFPGEPLVTAAVYANYDEVGVESLSGKFADHPAAEAIPLAQDEFIGFLNSQTNDLSHAAHQLAHAIATVEERLYATAGVRLVRMSGSGSSVFALYDEMRLAEKAAKEIGREHSDWWVAETTLH